MNQKQPALLMGYGIPATRSNTDKQSSDADRAMMAPLVETQRRHIERLEARLDALLTEKEKLKLRIWELEDQIYSRDRSRARFDEESA